MAAITARMTRVPGMGGADRDIERGEEVLRLTIVTVYIARPGFPFREGRKPALTRPA